MDPSAIEQSQRQVLEEYGLPEDGDVDLKTLKAAIELLQKKIDDAELFGDAPENMGWPQEPNDSNWDGPSPKG